MFDISANLIAKKGGSKALRTERSIIERCQGRITLIESGQADSDRRAHGNSLKQFAHVAVFQRDTTPRPVAAWLRCHECKYRRQGACFGAESS